MKKLIKILSISTLFILSGCNSSGNYSSIYSQTNDYELKVSSKIIDIPDGEIKSIKASTLRNKFAFDGGAIIYKSTDETVATVNESGEISYVGFGRCKIEASWTYEEVTYTDFATVNCYGIVTAENLNTFSDDYLTKQGRPYVSNNSLCLDHSAAGIDLGFKGSELKITVKGSNGSSYLHTYVDDEEDGTVINISASEKEYTICQGLENSFHKVRIIKATSPQYGRVYIKNFADDITYYRAPKKDLTIEFLGDSITCGYGNLGDPSSTATSAIEDAGVAYPYLTASQLDANFSVVALEGICAKDGSQNLYNSYEKYSFANKEIYDCAAYDADIVVIACGENDMWHATDSSFTYTTKQFREDYASFIQLVRSYHPTSYIVCMHGMMHASASDTATKAIKKAITISEDTNITQLTLVPNESGAETHPNKMGHLYFADELSTLITEYINK